MPVGAVISNEITSRYLPVQPQEGQAHQKRLVNILIFSVGTMSLKSRKLIGNFSISTEYKERKGFECKRITFRSQITTY